MDPVKSKIAGMLTPAKKSSSSGRGNTNVAEDLEIRPGGMLVQKRDFKSNRPDFVAVPVIKVKVKYGSSYHEICISSQASFGELKKMLSGPTGVHPQDQKLMYKKKERDSKSYLDVAGVKNGSKIVLIEDVTSRVKRSLEMLKSAKMEKFSKILQQISLEVDKLGEKLAALEATSSGGGKVADLDLDCLIEMLMTKLVVLDGIVVDGDLKQQKKIQEKKVHKYIESLDKLKLYNSLADESEARRNGDNKANLNGAKTQENCSISQNQIMQKQPLLLNQTNLTEIMQVQKQQQQHPLKSVVVTTNWETFD